MIIGAAVTVVGVVAVLGVYASGMVEGFSPDNKNVAETAQTSMKRLSSQTDDLEDSIVSVISTPFGESSEYDKTLSDVSKFIQEIQNDATVDQTEVIIAVEELRFLWIVRYDAARTEYLKLEHRLEYANNNTEKYFETQYALTDQIHNIKLREQRREYYNTQKQSFTEWQSQSSIMFSNTKRVMNRLNDVNIIIEQQTLEAYFTGLIQEESFAQVPEELASLDKELDSFREKTNEINLLFQHTD